MSFQIEKMHSNDAARYESPSSMVPAALLGLSILLVDHDKTSLFYMASMLQLLSFKVTTTEQACAAMSMIQEQHCQYKLVMASMDMPDMDSTSFLEILLQKNIPLVFMKSEKESATSTNAIAKGGCLFLEKPISIQDLQYVWQQAFTEDMIIQEKGVEDDVENNGRSARILDIADQVTRNVPQGCASVTSDMEHRCNNKPNKNNTVDRKGKRKLAEADDNVFQHQGSGSKAVSNPDSTQTLKQKPSKGKEPIVDEIESSRSEKRAKLFSDIDNFRKKIFSVPDKAKKEYNVNDPTAAGSAGKRRGIWNSQLHLKFTAALSALGDKHARPKSILRMMNVPNLTQRQVASHLQKYKCQVQRLNEMASTPCSPTYCSFGCFGSAQSLVDRYSSWNPNGARKSNLFGRGKPQPPNFLLPVLASAQKMMAPSPFDPSDENAYLYAPVETSPEMQFAFGGKLGIDRTTLSEFGNIPPNISCWAQKSDALGMNTSFATENPDVCSSFPAGGSDQLQNFPPETADIFDSISSFPNHTISDPRECISITSGCDFRSQKQNSADFLELSRLISEGTGGGTQLDTDLPEMNTEATQAEMDRFLKWLDETLNGDGI